MGYKETWCKEDWYILITMFLWLPSFIIGSILGVMWFGLRGGFSIYKSVGKWFDISEAKTKEKPDEV